MTAQELIDRLTELVEKHGDKEVFAQYYEVEEVDYNVEDDTIDID